MNPNQLIPVVMVLSAPKERQARMAEAMFPALIPVAPAQQAAVAAISASIQVDNEFRKTAAVRTEENAKSEALLGESLDLAELALNQAKGQKIPYADFEALTSPRLKNLLNSRPDLLDKLVDKKP